jgi:o-succinylbenzoate synthase
MKIEVSFYQLKSKTALNCRSSLLVRRGALLRFDFGQGLIGYADCHPWEELGDMALDSQLIQLKQGVFSTQIQQSMCFAKLDAEARLKRCSLMRSDSLLSHFLIPNLLDCSSDTIAQAEQVGYQIAKCKMGKDPKKEAAHLLQLSSNSHIKWRLDFNENLSVEQFEAVLHELKPIKGRIDFFEDPCPFQENVWESIQRNHDVSLACDRQVPLALGKPQAACVLILKPAIQPLFYLNLNGTQRLVVTSYLDHPLGQLSAAYIAAKLDSKRKEIHGLLSHQVYEPNAFSIELSWNSPQFIHPIGTGFGYDALLSSLNWQRWYEI